MYFDQKTPKQQALLSDDELLGLQAYAEEIDCSLSPSFFDQQVLESKQLGHLLTRALGSGIDYAESRVYSAGDDIRSINWRLSARSQETFVKTFYVESKPSINLVLDKRRPMVFGTRKRLKVTQAMRVASLLSYASDYHHLAFQGWIIDEKSRLQYFDNYTLFLQYANKPVEIQSLNDEKYYSNTALDVVLQEMVTRVEKGSLVYFISDFIAIDSSRSKNLLISSLSKLKEKSFIQAICIQDKAELELPVIGKIRLQDMYQNKSVKLDTEQVIDQQVFSKFSTQQAKKINTLFEDLGISLTHIFTDVDELHQLIHLPLGMA